MKSARRKSKRSGGRSSASGTNYAGPSPTAITYRGPVVPRGIATDTNVVLRRLTQVATAASNGSGVYSGIFGNLPSSSWQDWTALAPLYQEYRCLAFKLTFVPNYPFYGGAASQGQIILYPVRNSALTPASSYAAAYGWDGSKVFQTQGKESSITVKMATTIEAGFQNTVAPLATYGIGFYASGLTVSTTYGQVYLELLLQMHSSV